MVESERRKTGGKVTGYERNLQAAHDEGLDVKEKILKSDADALINGNRVALNKRKLTTTKEKNCKLAEERGHYHTAAGDILDISKTENRKQELKGRLWAYNKLIGLTGLIRAFEHRCYNSADAAEFLEVTEEFFLEAIECYRRRYGVCVNVDNYIIFFDPRLAVMALIE